MKKNITVVTGSRADYGLFFELLKKIKEDGAFNFQLIVTGAHLEKKFGETYKEIEKDGFEISQKIQMDLVDSSDLTILEAMGKSLPLFYRAYQELQSHLLLILGDRYEIFAAAQTAMICRLPIAHIHGGEITEGAIDESIRHAITKMSHLHFASNEEHRKRIIQMGENPERVFNTGALGLDYLKTATFLTKEELELELEVRFQKKIILVTFHPVTLDPKESLNGVNHLVEALAEINDASIVITMNNADPGGDLIAKRIHDFSLNTKNVILKKNLGQSRYSSLMRICDVVVGNSSSGIIEAPFLHTSTVNIGTRQKGRKQSESVIQVSENKDAILEGIHKALSLEFKKKVKNCVSYYGDGEASKHIVRILKETDLEGILKKKFFGV